MPAYNEAASIEELLTRARNVLETQNRSWNVVVVDDGSGDATAEIVENVSASEPRVLLVRHPQNLGLGPAILTGLARAAELRPGDQVLIVCMDADLTHPPEIIPQMCAAADDGVDLVIASRF